MDLNLSFLRKFYTKKETNEKAKIFFHQGWTDIINCLPLINYYSKSYDELELIIRKDSKDLIDFYISQFDNVKPIYLDKSILDSNSKTIRKISGKKNLLFFGGHDYLRTDNNKNSFALNPEKFFVEKFYTSYDINYIERVNSFNLKRNLKLEESTYKKVLGNYKDKYIIVHEDTKRGLSIIPESKNIRCINLNGASSIFFDYIKILENAKSIYLIDSVWAAICYLLDSKYQLLRNVEVNVKCLRGYKEMFLEPIELANWRVTQ